jgi:hypothetical protein
MARFTLSHNSRDTIALRQGVANLLLSFDQIDSVIKSLELARSQILDANRRRERQEQAEDLKAWDRERRSFNAVYTDPVEALNSETET